MSVYKSVNKKLKHYGLATSNIFSRNDEYIRRGRGFRRRQSNRCLRLDEEDLDEDALGDYDNTVPTDIAGTYEIHTDLPVEPENTQGESNPSTSKKPRLPKKLPKCVPDWKKEHPTYTHFPISDETASTRNIEERVGEKTPFEVFSLFFCDEVWEQIVSFSKKYACDHNSVEVQQFICVKNVKYIFMLIVLKYFTHANTQERCWTC